jgi:hypothetical protein
MGNTTSIEPPSVPSPIQHVANRIQFKDLAHFSFKGKREAIMYVKIFEILTNTCSTARLTEYEKIFYPLQDVRFGIYIFFTFSIVIRRSLRRQI